jgi:hypothetical protein
MPKTLHERVSGQFAYATNEEIIILLLLGGGGGGLTALLRKPKKLDQEPELNEGCASQELGNWPKHRNLNPGKQ